MADERRFITPAEAAAELRVSTDTVLRLIAAGTLPAIRVSPRVIRIPVPAFEFFRAGRVSKPRRVIVRQTSSEPAFGTGEQIPDVEAV